jgi:hypothetical protein
VRGPGPNGLDIQLFPFKRLFEVDFHVALVATALLPMAFVGCIFLAKAIQNPHN